MIAPSKVRASVFGAAMLLFAPAGTHAALAGSNPCAGLSPITTLAGLPFAGVVSASSLQGFNFDNEGFAHDPAVTPMSLGSSIESSLRILSLNASTGAFTGQMFGPWATNSGVAVTGTIVAGTGPTFSIKFSYNPPTKIVGTSFTYNFTGAFQSLLVPMTGLFGSTTCGMPLYIAGTYVVVTHSNIIGKGGTSLPAPFSGVSYLATIPH